MKDPTLIKNPSVMTEDYKQRIKAKEEIRAKHKGRPHDRKGKSRTQAELTIDQVATLKNLCEANERLTYKELCASIGIHKAPAGKSRQLLIDRIGKYFNMEYTRAKGEKYPKYRITDIKEIPYKEVKDDHNAYLYFAVKLLDIIPCDGKEHSFTYSDLAQRIGYIKNFGSMVNKQFPRKKTVTVSVYTDTNGKEHESKKTYINNGDNEYLNCIKGDINDNLNKMVRNGFIRSRNGYSIQTSKLLNGKELEEIRANPYSTTEELNTTPKSVTEWRTVYNEEEQEIISEYWADIEYMCYSSPKHYEALKKNPILMNSITEKKMELGKDPKNLKSLEERLRTKEFIDKYESVVSVSEIRVIVEVLVNPYKGQSIDKELLDNAREEFLGQSILNFLFGTKRNKPMTINKADTTHYASAECEERYNMHINEEAVKRAKAKAKAKGKTLHPFRDGRPTGKAYTFEQYEVMKRRIK